MNGVVFQTSTMITAASAVSGEAVQAIGWAIRPELLQDHVDDPEHVVEHPRPHLRRDHGRDRPGDQHRGAQEAAAAEMRVERQRDAQAQDGLDRDRDDGEHHRVADGGPPVGIGQQVAEIGRCRRTARAERSARLASVNANQIVRSSGQPATAASTSSIGATNSQAARVRSRVRRDARPAGAGTAPAWPAASISPWRALPSRGRGPTAATSVPPRDSRSSFFASAARLVGAVGLLAQHLVHRVEELGADLVVLDAGHPRRPGHRVDEHLVERAEERHRGQDLRVLVEALDRRVVGALDRAALLLLRRGQVAHEVDRGVGVARCRPRRRAASRRARRWACRPAPPAGRAATPILSLTGLSAAWPSAQA